MATRYELDTDLRLPLVPRTSKVKEDAELPVIEDLNILYNALQNLALAVEELAETEGGDLTITSASATTISATDTFYSLAGTYTASELEAFDSPSNGQLRKTGERSKNVLVNLSAEISGTQGDFVTLRIRKYDASATTTETVVQETREIYNLAGATDIAFFNLLAPAILEENDYVFLEVANNSSTDNVTGRVDSYLRVLTR